jgi:hypothetical protein
VAGAIPHERCIEAAAEYLIEHVRRRCELTFAEAERGPRDTDERRGFPRFGGLVPNVPFANVPLPDMGEHFESAVENRLSDIVIKRSAIERGLAARMSSGCEKDSDESGSACRESPKRQRKIGAGGSHKTSLSMRFVSQSVGGGKATSIARELSLF